MKFLLKLFGTIALVQVVLAVLLLGAFFGIIAIIAAHVQ